MLLMDGICISKNCNKCNEIRFTFRISQLCKKYFTNPKLIALMEFPVIFLGASPKDIPALYSLMNYGGFVLRTWYPIGGFYELVLAMKSVGEEQGVQFHFDSAIEK